MWRRFLPAEGAPPVSRTDAILVGLLLASLVIAGASTTVDPDLFHVLTLARTLIADGRFPAADPFAFTPTRTPVVHHEWLAGLVLYPVVRAGGATGLLLLAHAAHLVAVGLAVLLARRRGAGIVTLAFLAPLGIAMCLPGLTVLRAQVFTLICVGVVLWWLDADRHGARGWTLAYLVLQLVWQNLHGGFVVGPGLIALYAIEQWTRRAPIGHLVLVLVASAALVLVTPYGTAYPPYLWEALRLDRSIIGEWRVLADAPIRVPFWALATLIFVYALLPGGLRASPGWLLVLVCAIGAYRHQRFLSVYGIVWLAYVPPMVARVRLGTIFRRLWSARPRLTRVFLVVVLAAALARNVRERRWELQIPTRPDAQGIVYPVGVVRYAAMHGLRGNMITPFAIGAFVSWQLHPAVRVSLDGRFEAAYAPRLAAEHVAFYAGWPSWRAFLVAYPADYVLAMRTDAITTILERDPDWRTVYEDDVFTLLARAGLPLPLADRRGERLVGAFP